jgi:hypothetical protein
MLTDTACRNLKRHQSIVCTALKIELAGGSTSWTHCRSYKRDQWLKSKVREYLPLKRNGYFKRFPHRR